MYMYHSFLIHSSADGHLGCFHVLAIINSAAMNIGVHVGSLILEFLGCHIRCLTILLGILHEQALRLHAEEKDLNEPSLQERDKEKAFKRRISLVVLMSQSCE